MIWDPEPGVIHMYLELFQQIRLLHHQSPQMLEVRQIVTFSFSHTERGSITIYYTAVSELTSATVLLMWSIKFSKSTRLKRGCCLSLCSSAANRSSWCFSMEPKRNKTIVLYSLGEIKTKTRLCWDHSAVDYQLSMGCGCGFQTSGLILQQKGSSLPLWWECKKAASLSAVRTAAETEPTCSPPRSASAPQQTQMIMKIPKHKLSSCRVFRCRLSPGPAVLWAVSRSGLPAPGPPPLPPGWQRLLLHWAPASRKTPRFGPAAVRAASRLPAACTSHRGTQREFWRMCEKKQDKLNYEMHCSVKQWFKVKSRNQSFTFIILSRISMV